MITFRFFARTSPQFKKPAIVQSCGEGLLSYSRGTLGLTLSAGFLPVIGGKWIILVANVSFNGQRCKDGKGPPQGISSP
jgi:hypothetical protein